MKKLSLIICILTLTVALYAKRSDNNGVNNFINRDESFASSLDIKVKDPNTAKASYSSSDSTRSGTVRDRIIDFAKTKLGATYVWGATGPNVFDCSGFVRFVFQNAADISLPRVSSDQATYKPRISSMNMKKGDLVFFETTGRGRISHVGIYMGDSQFIHASSGGKRVKVSSLDGGYYNKTFRWAINPF